MGSFFAKRSQGREASFRQPSQSAATQAPATVPRGVCPEPQAHAGDYFAGDRRCFHTPDSKKKAAEVFCNNLGRVFVPAHALTHPTPNTTPYSRSRSRT